MRGFAPALPSRCARGAPLALPPVRIWEEMKINVFETMGLGHPVCPGLVPGRSLMHDRAGWALHKGGSCLYFLTWERNVPV